MPPPVPPKALANPQTPLIKKPIFKSSQPTPSFSPLTAVLDSFASDSNLTHAVEVAADRASEVPELFRSVVGDVVGVRVPPNTPAGTPVKGKAVLGAGGSLPINFNGLVQQAKQKGKEIVSGYLPSMPMPVVAVVAGQGFGVAGDAAGWIQEWWKAERLGKVVEGCLPRRELDILVVGGTPVPLLAFPSDPLFYFHF